MKLLAARTITVGFILAFTHLVTTPTPVLCSHHCGDIHLMGATEHLGHEHDTNHDHDQTHDDHDADSGQRDEHCVDVSIVVDILRPVATWTSSQLVTIQAMVTTIMPPVKTASRLQSALDDDPDPPQAPSERLGRLLI